MLAYLRSPDALNNTMQMIEPQLKEQANPDQLRLYLNMAGAGAGMMISQIENPHPALTKLGALIQGVCLDASDYVKSAKLDDATKCRRALSILIDSAKALKIKDSKDVMAMTLPNYLKEMNSMVKSFKEALSVYGLNADALLDSIKVTSQMKDNTCDLTIDFVAFGSARQLQLPLAKDPTGEWTLDPMVMSSVMGAVMSGMGPQQGPPAEL